MRRLALLALFICATASAETKKPIDPKDAALMDRMVDAIEKLVVAVYDVRTDCAKVAQAIKAATPGDNKLATELAPRMESAQAPAMQQYTADMHAARLKALRPKFKDGTSKCRSDKTVVTAWAEDALAVATWGELVIEPGPPPRPADYEAKLKKLDAALAAYDAAGKKFETVASDKDCTARAKQIPAFASAFKKQETALTALDKQMQEAVLLDEARMTLQARPGKLYLAARDKCAANKAFVKADKASKLFPPATK